MTRAGAEAQGPLVTLYVAAYNQENYVRSAIEGAFAQTYSPLEIVLSDDASRDGTFAVMRAMAARYGGPHRIVLNRNPVNLGIPRHLDRIMELSRGALIVQNAGDDISLPHRVERLVVAWRAGGGRIQALHSAKVRIDEAGTVLGRQEDARPINRHSPFELLVRPPTVSGASMAWDRKVFDAFGPLGDTPIFEDYPICLRAAVLGEVVYLDEPLLLYRLGGRSEAPSETIGHYALYGHRLTFITWHLSFCRQFLRDLDKVASDDTAALRRQCLKNLRDYSLDLELASMSHRRRFAALPGAALSALRKDDVAILRKTLKYAFDTPYMAWLTWRYGSVGLSRLRSRLGPDAAVFEGKEDV
jgi:glycosyltransferase involved in cell wall biosynthesis